MAKKAEIVEPITNLPKIKIPEDNALDELYQTISNRFRSNEFIMAYEDCMRDCESIVLQEINKLKGKANGT